MPGAEVAMTTTEMLTAFAEAMRTHRDAAEQADRDGDYIGAVIHRACASGISAVADGIAMAVVVPAYYRFPEMRPMAEIVAAPTETELVGHEAEMELCDDFLIDAGFDAIRDGYDPDCDPGTHPDAPTYNECIEGVE
jgi:F0F1-type ATP synthase membrane subunit c/vacuolar-type H+-ATPase subunit K